MNEPNEITMDKKLNFKPKTNKKVKITKNIISQMITQNCLHVDFLIQVT